MTAESRFDRQLPSILEDLYVGPSPDYRDEVLATATAKRQRPAWTFPGRWFPMADFAGRLSAPARFPIRSLAVALVIVALIVAGALIYIGSRPQLPAPFGRAANGLIAYSQGSSLYVTDKATGASHVLISGAAQNGFGWWAFSPDGTKLAYAREAIQGYDADGHAVQSVAVANADGSGLKQLTPTPLIEAGTVGWAPDDRSILIDNLVHDVWTVSIIATDGSGVRNLDLGMAADSPAYRPGSDGKEILFRGHPTDGTIQLYLVKVDGSGLRPLGNGVAAGNGAGWNLSGPTWSPDGTRVAYNSVEKDAQGNYRASVHVVAVDSGADAALPASPTTAEQAWPSWSPDGRSLAVKRWDSTGADYLGLVPADGHDGGRDIGPKPEAGKNPDWIVAWAPDGSTILAYTDATLAVVEIDAATGTYTTPPWTTTGMPAWQRVAP